jgi:metal-responsive CopG/Arc/MetJ family transcriptional regulator
MQKSVTTSVRLPREIMRQVERKVVSASCGRDQVIIRALEYYLSDKEQIAYETEARHQSQLATRLDDPDSPWDQMIESDIQEP